MIDYPDMYGRAEAMCEFAAELMQNPKRYKAERDLWLKIWESTQARKRDMQSGRLSVIKEIGE